MRSLDKKYRKVLIILLLLVIILNFGIPGFIQPVIILAADATDYDFTDELGTDRVGIGFTWTASTKTLTITGIKNSSALLKLPTSSIIDIQGDIENTIKGIYCEGSLKIKGNEKAILKITECCSNEDEDNIYAGIYSPDGKITIDSGNIDVVISGLTTITGRSYYGIRGRYITINDGNINIDLSGTSGEGVVHAIQIVNGSIIINGGNINLTSDGNTIYKYGVVIDKPIEINGGTLIAKTEGDYNVFSEIPSINAQVDWNILYNKEDTNIENAVEADITDIYNIYQCKLIKIELISSEPSTTSASNAIDYDFTDEIGADRVGIGFVWKGSTKTLTITGIKNSNALLKLPTGSIIDIQGDIENTIKGIYCEGSLTIKGNEKAVLKISECCNVEEEENVWAGIYSPDSKLTIDSGNIDMVISGLTSASGRSYYGIRGRFITINNANININLSGVNDETLIRAIQIIDGYIIINGGNINLVAGSSAIHKYGIAQYDKEIEINGGTVTAISNTSGDYTLNGSVTMNGGSLTAKAMKAEGIYKIFSKVPSINAQVDWNILYNKDDTNIENAVEADITDIYNIYQCELIKIEMKKSTTAISISSPKTEICVGEKTNITATIEPNDSDDTIIWSSSNENIATVSENGEITGIAPGIATITAKSGDFSDSKNINVICNITLDPNGEEGVELKTLYTNTNGTLEELPILSSESNVFIKWIDSEGNEVTADTIFVKNTSIYAQWEVKAISVSEQKKSVKYGETSSVDYDIISNFSGTYNITIENLQEGVILNDNEITFIETGSGSYTSTITLNISNTAGACLIDNLKIIVNDVINSNNFSLKIDKVDPIYEKPVAKILLYNETAQELIDVGTTNDGVMQYSLDGINYSIDIPKAKDIGTYKVYYKVIGDNNHLDSEAKSIDVDILEYILGDIDGDTEINARDAKLAIQCFTGKIVLTETQKKAANVYPDEEINARDAKLIIQFFTGKISSF